MKQRAEQLKADGYVPAMASTAYQNPKYTKGVGEWWANRHMQAEYDTNDTGYEKMPDDWTPSRTAGRSLSGHRRTYRRLYSGAGINLRMPSASSIRDFATTQRGRSFDIPVEATTKNGTVSGWVRVTRTEDGVWGAQSLGFPQNQVQVAHAVSAVLEARKVTTALSGCETMNQYHAQRITRMGVQLKDVKDSQLVSATRDPCAIADAITACRVTDLPDPDMPSTISDTSRSGTYSRGSPSNPTLNAIPRGRRGFIASSSSNRAGNGIGSVGDVISTRSRGEDCGMISTNASLVDDLSRPRLPFTRSTDSVDGSSNRVRVTFSLPSSTSASTTAGVPPSSPTIRASTHR